MERRITNKEHKNLTHVKNLIKKGGGSCQLVHWLTEHLSTPYDGLFGPKKLVRLVCPTKKLCL